MSETIACRLTAPLPGAIATIAVRGPRWLSIIAQCLGKPLAENQWSVGRIRFIPWPILNWSEHTVACRVDDHTLEIHCHGGVAVSDAILQSLQTHGCRVVDQSGWRAVALDSTSTSPEQRLSSLCNQALIQATSERATGILLDQAGGALYSYFVELDQLLQLEQWASAKELFESVARWNELGRRLIEPWRVVLAGPPNVGKSSLINALSGQSLAIVHPEAGTTRDWIEALTQIDGWPISLTDTAGMRTTEELIEREGVCRAIERIGQADLVVVVVDATIGWTQQHEAILELCQQTDSKPRVLIAWNKCDLASGGDGAERTRGYPVVKCSAERDVSPLLAAISRLLVPQQPACGQAIVFDARHQQLLEEIAARLQFPVAPNSVGELKLLAHQLRFGRFSSYI